MIFKSMVGRFLEMVLIVAASVSAGAQTQGTERLSFPQPGSENYWLLVDDFANSAVDFAYVQRFAQVREGSLAERQCQQYSRIAVDYANRLTELRKAGVSQESEFWNDVRLYS